MSIELYDATIPVFVKNLQNLSSFIDKAEAWSAETGHSFPPLTEIRLAPDMLAFNRQIHIASDGAKGAAGRLAGIEIPSFPDTETTFAELKQRIAKTIAYVGEVTPQQVNGNETRTIELKFGKRAMNFTARDFVFQFALPNFMFHIVTAYGLLRAQGVPLGKMDYLLGVEAAAAMAAAG